MTTVNASRKELEKILSTSGLRVTPQGVASPPCVFVAPSNAWLTPSQLAYGRVNVNWAIIGIVASPGEASIAEVDRLAQDILLACITLPAGWGHPVINAPGILTLSGLPYLAFRAEIGGVL